MMEDMADIVNNHVGPGANIAGALIQAGNIGGVSFQSGGRVEFDAAAATRAAADTHEDDLLAILFLTAKRVVKAGGGSDEFAAKVREAGIRVTDET